MEAMAANQVGTTSCRVVGAGPCTIRQCRHVRAISFVSASGLSSRNSAAVSCCFSSSGGGGNRTARSSCTKLFFGGFGKPDGVRLRKTQCAGAAQEAAQAEEGTEVLEEDEDDVEGASSNGSNDVAPSFLEEFKAALAANDEERVAKLEAEWSDLQTGKDALAKQVATLTEESQNAKDRLLRLNADFDNFRKRSQTEKASVSSMVKSDVIESLLPMVDNFERAKSSIKIGTEGEEKIDKSYQGIYKQFVEIMKGLGVVAVETVGKAFDPNVHEAILREESTEFDEDIVIQEFRRGFSIGSKLMRPAMVKVSAGPGPGKGGGSDGAAQKEQGEEAKGNDTQ